MSNSNSETRFIRWLQPGLTTLLVALALGSILFWLMQISSVSQAAPELRLVDTPVPSPVAAALGRALGADAGVSGSTTNTSTSTNTRTNPGSSALVLAAVIAGGSNQGEALISVNGQKAQFFRTGDPVQPGLYLVQVGLRSASLSATPQGNPTWVLSIAAPVLPAASGSAPTQ